jgi:hypothetical protein
VATPAGGDDLHQVNEIERQPGLSIATDNKGLSGALATRPALDLPIVVSEWARNNHEIIRVVLDRYNNRETINLRSWWRDDDGTYKPGRSGLTLAIKHLPALAQGLADALQQARTLGLVEVPTTTTTKDRTAAARQRRYRQRRKRTVTEA